MSTVYTIRVPRAGSTLGLRWIPQGPEPILVTGVIGPAAAAGVPPGIRIVRVADTATPNDAAFLEAVAEWQRSGSLTVRIVGTSEASSRGVNPLINYPWGQEDEELWELKREEPPDEFLRRCWPWGFKGFRGVAASASPPPAGSPPPPDTSAPRSARRTRDPQSAVLDAPATSGARPRAPTRRRRARSLGPAPPRPPVLQPPRVPILPLSSPPPIPLDVPIRDSRRWSPPRRKRSQRSLRTR
eukprot:TRINITY_DN46790_c0_g1_i1.p1 TRINITY_DN46790_c0_g1~~TRINITY_DN46790_c0_g1_i1.p1  ORF type:complete len:258 (+),score=33.81 TRINITY_DN46790_c0_g1_i1:50-775(+)